MSLFLSRHRSSAYDQYDFLIGLRVSRTSLQISRGGWMHFPSVSIRFKQHLPGVLLHGFFFRCGFAFISYWLGRSTFSSGSHGHPYGAFVGGLVSCLLAVSFGLHIVLWSETDKEELNHYLVSSGVQLIPKLRVISIFFTLPWGR